jgi:hypothetical protein
MNHMPTCPKFISEFIQIKFRKNEEDLIWCRHVQGRGDMMAARVWGDTQTAHAGARELGRLHIVATGHGGGEEVPPATEEEKKCR